MTTTSTGDAARIQSAILRVLFALSLGWAFLFPVAAVVEGQAPADANPFIGDSLSLLLAAAGAVVVSILAFRFFPGFLRLSHSISAAFLIARMLLYLPLMFLFLAAILALIEFVHLKATGDPANPQYGMSVLMVALWYPALLTPAATTCAVWLAARREIG